MKSSLKRSRRLPYTPNSQIPTEYEEQCAVIRWARMMADTGQEPRLALLHGDSSGVRMSIGAAVKMKRAGRLKSWPDLFLAVPTKVEIADGWATMAVNGLFIELKRLDGRADKEQLALHELLRAQGYAVHVCRGSEAAIAVLREYLGMK